MSKISNQEQILASTSEALFFFCSCGESQLLELLYASSSRFNVPVFVNYNNLSCAVWESKYLFKSTASTPDFAQSSLAPRLF